MILKIGPNSSLRFGASAVETGRAVFSGLNFGGGGTDVFVGKPDGLFASGL